jgi:hypothetical protein
MSDKPELRRVHIGTFADLPSVLYFPAGSLRPAEKIFEREHAKRQAIAKAPKIAALRKARARGKLRQALQRLIGGGR